MKAFRVLVVKVLKLLPLPLAMLMLLLFAKSATASAIHGLELWALRVLPALLPFMFLCAYMEQRGVFSRLTEKSFVLPALALLGQVGGYPLGSRLLSGLVERGAIGPAAAQRLAVPLNQCSVNFLLSVVAIAMYDNTALFVPLVSAQLISACVLLLCSGRVSLRPAMGEGASPYSSNSSAQSFTCAVESAAGAGLKVGVCITLCCVASGILEASGLVALLCRVLPLPEKTLTALLCGMLEFTRGVELVQTSGLPLCIQLGLCSFLTSFGGISSALQSACFVHFDRFSRYLALRLVMGLVSGLCAGLLCLWLVPNSRLAVMSQSMQGYGDNAFIMGGILVCSATALLFVSLVTLALRGQGSKRTA